MKNIKINFHNIWNLYYVIFFGFLFLMIILLTLKYNDISQRYHAQMRHYTEIISSSVSSNFLQHEMILNIFGQKLLEEDYYKNQKKSKELLDDLIKYNPYFAALGIADLDGNILIASSNVNLKNKKNLLDKKTTHYDFKKSLNSDNMIIGRTYFFKNINEWIIPLRKLIKDKKGDALGVAIAGIKNEKNTNYIDTLMLSKEKTVLIVKDFNDKNELYRSYYSNSKNISSEALYSIPLSSKSFHDVNKAIVEKYNFNINALRKNKQTVSINTLTEFNEYKIAGIKYNEKYNYWVVVSGKNSEVVYEFLLILFVYVFLFILIFLVFYYLFKIIATSEKRKKEELIFEAQHDTLTSLPNRTYMYEHIGAWKSKHKQKYDVLYIDLDNFKNINDKFGHSIGDKILQEVALRLKSFFSDSDMLIRQGGDEFIVLKECLNPADIENNFLKLIKLISEVYHIDSKEFRIGMSVGVSSFPKDGANIEELLSLADTAMYEAKKRKNSYCFFSEKMRYANAIKADIEQELRGAIENNELWMVYQPQINADGSLYGVEALVRWENKRLGFVGPDKFITVAEESGLMNELGEFIIITSLKEIIDIQAQEKIIFSLSINISVMQLMESNFLSNILSLIKNEQFDKSLITLEITESLSIEDLDEVLPILHAIRDEGIEISLDDFGTGYSSLSVLRELPISELKIDKSFIDKILYDESEKSLVKSIIDIGKNFNMKTLAEGVESQEQDYELKLAKCDIIQGYYYSKPLVKNDLIKYINKNYKTGE